MKVPLLCPLGDGQPILQWDLILCYECDDFMLLANITFHLLTENLTLLRIPLLSVSLIFLYSTYYHSHHVDIGPVFSSTCAYIVLGVTLAL